MIDLSREKRFLTWLVDHSTDRVIDLDTHDQREALLEEYGKTLTEVTGADFEKILSGLFPLG